MDAVSASGNAVFYMNAVPFDSEPRRYWYVADAMQVMFDERMILRKFEEISMKIEYDRIVIGEGRVLKICAQNSSMDLVEVAKR